MVCHIISNIIFSTTSMSNKRWYFLQLPLFLAEAFGWKIVSSLALNIYMSFASYEVVPATYFPILSIKISIVDLGVSFLPIEFVV